ncbi:MAG: DNA mismatch repair protein MutS [Candidatus Thorarchaeota archaeon]|nr:MAG: DNA mismatch repair protein MutS [Candidatus Thorarchaeota archaeon]
MPKPKQTPMQRQYLQLKKRYPDSILLFRLGDFYEMFNEDAKQASKILDIVLTARGEGVDRWPMCGVPYHAIDSYVPKLLQAGFTVAIADQVEDASQAKGLVKRDVVRVITPGTVLESTILDDTSNNYLMALVEHDGKVGVSAIDVSTGEFLATEFEGSLKDEKTGNEVSRLSPSEILLPESQARHGETHSFDDSVARVTVRKDSDFSAHAAEGRLKEVFGVSTLDGFGLSEKRAALGACGAVLAYLREVYRNSTVALSGIRVYDVQDHLILDSATQRNLELIKNARDGSTRGTLLSVLSKTVTPMGRRKMKQWILRPLRHVKAIDERLDAVEEMARSALVRNRIRETLRDLGDLERVTSRIAFGKAGARDLVALRVALSKLPAIKEALLKCETNLLRQAGDSIDVLDDLRETLTRAVVDDPPVSVKDGGMIKKGYSDELDELVEGIRSDKKWIASLQETERRRTGIKSLRVGYNKVFGYYIEVTKSNLSQVPEEYERKQTLANAERFITPELKEKETTVLAGEERINKLEYEIYESLRAEVEKQSHILRKNSSSVAIADVTVALADVAVSNCYCRPKVTDDTAIRIIEGRHPSMEVILGQNEFVPNDVEIGDGGNTLIIVTGPNMAGKSTYMRQCALIVLLAQMGSFVPAKKAEIGLVDRIFTRVGAFDDLTARQSTFMVEMIETANILNSATERSLVILDEIGRGTSTFDGMALAWAVAERIIQMKTRAMFATHFHQLTEMASQYHGVKNVHTLARETGDTIVFMHKVVDGGTDKSYGVHVAALAGVPRAVVTRAREILNRIESENSVTIGDPSDGKQETIQTSLEGFLAEDPIVEKIRHLDLERMTPIDALLRLKELQEEAKEREE